MKNRQTDPSLLELLLEILRIPAVQLLAVLVVIVGLYVVVCVDFDDTISDCIRQWHDVGVYARAEELCK